jgi:IPT/TIG domain-containing protein
MSRRGIGFALEAGMRGGRWWWAFAVLLIAVTLTWYVGHSSALEERLGWLASQPSVTTAFQNPESSRSDALTMLIAFAVLTPIVAFVVQMALLLLAKLSEPVLESVHIPTWLSTPAVGVVSILTIYATSQSWLPTSLYGLGLIARAYLVYSQETPPLFNLIDQWHDQPATTYTASRSVTAGEHEVKVEYYERGGDALVQVSWTGGTATPTLTALTPNNTAAGGPAFTLTLDGTNFASGSTALWNGAARATTFVSATRVTASVPASDIATAGSASVTVRNSDG